jgi:hypothetical protein
MRAGVLLLTVTALGCASAPRAPAIEVPERCVCPTAAKDCERAVAGIAPHSPATMAPEELNELYRKRALASVTVNTDASLEQEGLVDDAQRQLDALDPSVIAAAASLGAEGPEHDVLRAMHELHELATRDDASPAAERKVLLWQRFEAEVETFRASAIEAIAGRLADVLLDRKAVASTVAKVADWVNKDYAPTADQRLAFATERARIKLVELVTPTARKLTDAIVEKRKGRWLAVLHGKM